MRSLGHAAGSVDEHGTGQEHPPSTSLQDLIKQALRARSNIMFSGKTGAAVASGTKDDAATAEKPTYGLARAAIDVVFKELPSSVSHSLWRVVRAKARSPPVRHDP